MVDKYPTETVEIHRKFGEVLTHPGLNEKFQWWVNKFSRPLVSDFDHRTINDIFRFQKNAIILFNTNKNETLKNLLETVSESHQG